MFKVFDLLLQIEYSLFEESVLGCFFSTFLRYAYFGVLSAQTGFVLFALRTCEVFVFVEVVGEHILNHLLSDLVYVMVVLCRTVLLLTRFY